MIAFIALNKINMLFPAKRDESFDIFGFVFNR